MLGVAHGSLGAQGNQAGAEVALWLGGLLGTALIPLYYRGYRQAALPMRSGAATLHTALLVAAAGVALFGALTHLLTAVDIAGALATNTPPKSPAEAFAPAVSGLFIAGLLSVVSACAAAACLCWAYLRTPRTGAGLPVLLNPVVVTLLVGAGASATEDLTKYLAPAAANIAHCVFFLAVHAARVQPKRNPQ
jgi:hypothetical protein